MNTALNKPAVRQKKAILKWAVSLWIACFMITPGLYGDIVVDRIVAQVNDDIITLSDLNQAIEPYIEKVKSMEHPPLKEQEMLYKIRTEMIDELIANKLTDQAAREKGINVSEKNIDAAIESIKKQYKLTQEQLEAELEKEGGTLQEYRQSIYEQMLRDRLKNQEIQSKIVITTEDIEAYYNENIDLYGGKEKYHLRSIIKRIPQFADAAEMKSLAMEMDDIIKKLDNGGSFIELAKAHSDLLAEQGGDIGKFELRELSMDIRTIVQDLHAGGHSPVLNTAQGFQIFYLQEIVQTEGTPISTVSDEIKKILYKKVEEKKFKEWVGSLRENAHIKIVQ